MNLPENGAADLQRYREPPVVQLLSGALPVQGRHQNKVWRGLAQQFGNTEPGVSIYLKWVAKNEILATELACALAGQALNLPVPKGMLVVASKEQLPGLPARVTGAPTDSLLCYGSEMQWPDDSAARPVGSAAVEEWIWRRICETSQGGVGAVWDELVANEDRHHENLVYDGSKWWLIDHEYSLTPVAKVMRRFAEQATRLALLDHRSRANNLAFQVVQRRPKDHNMESLPGSWSKNRIRLQWLCEQAQTWTTGIPQIDTVLIMTHVYLRSIELRLPALPLHLHQRLEKPEKSLLWTSSNITTSKTRRNTRPPRA